MPAFVSIIAPVFVVFIKIQFSAFNFFLLTPLPVKRGRNRCVSYVCGVTFQTDLLTEFFPKARIGVRNEGGRRYPLTVPQFLVGKEWQIRLRFWFFQKFHQSSPISSDLGWWNLLFRFLKRVFCQGYRVMYPYFQKTAPKARRESGCSRNFTEEGAHGLVYPFLPDFHCLEK